MTPDGVSKADWDRVHELALEVVNASAGDDESLSKAAVIRVLEVLDELQEKYGPLPSLLATRADYVDAPDEREYWLQAAHEQALGRSDKPNLIWIATSLASFYVEEVGNREQGHLWVERSENYLAASPDKTETEEVQRLREALEAL